MPGTGRRPPHQLPTLSSYLASLFLKGGERRAHRGWQSWTWGLAPACCQWLPQGRRDEGRVDLGEARVTLDVLALGDDAIAEGNAAGAALQLAYLKARAALAAHIEPIAVALRRED